MSATVVILGASYAKGWTPLPLPGVTFVNRGVAGEQSVEIWRRFERDVVSHQPRAVIIWGFINDFFRTPRPDVERAAQHVRDNYLEMLARAEAVHITPIVATEVTIGIRAGIVEAAKTLVGDILGKRSYADYINQRVRESNAWLREIAESRGLLLLDFEAALADGGKRRKRAFTAADGSHLTPAAYDRLARYADQPLRAKLLGGAH